MKRIPDGVRESMTTTGAATTCAPVKLDSDSWEAAVFFQLAGPECKEDRRVLRMAEDPLPVGIETDLVNHDSAAVAVLRFEVYTSANDPLVGEVLITPGEGKSHFETLRLLSTQQRLCWFFADETFWLIHAQQITLREEHRAEFDDLLRDATKHDALIRCTGRYDAQAALTNMTVRYGLRNEQTVGDRRTSSSQHKTIN
ncbi:MAG: hypothetical protein OEU36_20665 [Gammaproteobacteria bacterium]|nr:hypothetical protein [Gammaproteobacteria bacterium]